MIGIQTISIRVSCDDIDSTGEDDVALSVSGRGDIEHFQRAFRAVLIGAGFFPETVARAIPDDEEIGAFFLTPAGEALLDQQQNEETLSTYVSRPGEEHPTFRAVPPLAPWPFPTEPYADIHFDPADGSDTTSVTEVNMKEGQA